MSKINLTELLKAHMPPPAPPKSKVRPHFRVTKRSVNAKNCYHDEPRLRWVVYRRFNGVVRKTSVRYGPNDDPSEAEEHAQAVARRLNRWPGEKLASFVF